MSLVCGTPPIVLALCCRLKRTRAWPQKHPSKLSLAPQPFRCERNRLWVALLPCLAARVAPARRNCGFPASPRPATRLQVYGQALFDSAVDEGILMPRSDAVEDALSIAHAGMVTHNAQVAKSDATLALVVAQLAGRSELLERSQAAQRAALDREAAAQADCRAAIASADASRCRHDAAVGVMRRQLADAQAASAADARVTADLKAQLAAALLDHGALQLQTLHGRTAGRIALVGSGSGPGSVGGLLLPASWAGGASGASPLARAGRGGASVHPLTPRGGHGSDSPSAFRRSSSSKLLALSAARGNAAASPSSEWLAFGELKGINVGELTAYLQQCEDVAGGSQPGGAPVGASDAAQGNGVASGALAENASGTPRAIRAAEDGSPLASGGALAPWATAAAVAVAVAPSPSTAQAPR